MNKRILLIGGGGTLGTYTAEELLKQEYFVDIICLEDKISNDKNLKYYKVQANLKYLEEFLRNKTIR